ncbi:unnamed protein product [Lymnaea stagnalis]|uniref:Uncharacterized protein n=1 Tax=Lymnaea stagnalis TaxID=6523 RepID=A0AAV2H5V6_LYMST
MAKFFLCVLYLWLGQCACQQSRITLHMDSTVPDPEGGAKDLVLSAVVLRTVNSIFCHGSAGDSFVIRIDPNSGNMEIIDNTVGFSNRTKFIDSCMPASNPVQCTTTHVCTTGSNCVVNLAVDCAQTQGPKKWEKIPQIEVSLVDRHGELAMENCFVMCLDSGFAEEGLDLGHQGLSYLAIGFIVAGTVLAGSLLVIGFVVWKIKDMRRFERPQRNSQHHIHYVK